MSQVYYKQWFLGFTTSKQSSSTLNLTLTTEEFSLMINSSKKYILNDNSDLKMKIIYVKRYLYFIKRIYFFRGDLQKYIHEDDIKLLSKEKYSNSNKINIDEKLLTSDKENIKKAKIDIPETT